MSEELKTVNDNVIHLEEQDAALVFRQKEMAIEIVIPNGDKDDHVPASEATILASWFAYACVTDRPEIRKAIGIIEKCYTEDIEKWLKETGKRK